MVYWYRVKVFGSLRWITNASVTLYLGFWQLDVIIDKYFTSRYLMTRWCLWHNQSSRIQHLKLEDVKSCNASMSTVSSITSRYDNY